MGIILTAVGEEAQVDDGSGPMVRDSKSGKYRRTRLNCYLTCRRLKSRVTPGFPLFRSHFFDFSHCFSSGISGLRATIRRSAQVFGVRCDRVEGEGQ